jgi:hypothetical protein
LQPPCSQQLQKLRRQHGVPILAALAHLDTISMRLESMSPTRSMTTSQPRRPAP